MRPYSLITLARLLVGLGLIAGILTPIGLTVRAQPETATLTIFSTACPDSAYSERNLDESQCIPVQGVTYTATTADGDANGQCVTNKLYVTGTGAICAISGVPFETTVSVTQDDAGLPAGVEATGDNPASIYTSIPVSVAVLNLRYYNRHLETEAPAPAPTEGSTTDETDPTATSEPVVSNTAEATETLTAETDGSTAAIYAGDCDSDFTDAPVATLTNVRPPVGDTAGADAASAVEKSFTTLDLPLDDILADDHVLVVFDKDDDTVPLACGAIGGVVAEDGALAIGLQVVGTSRYSGIAYLSSDGAQTLTTVFLAENLSADEIPVA